MSAIQEFIIHISNCKDLVIEKAIHHSGDFIKRGWLTFHKTKVHWDNYTIDISCHSIKWIYRTLQIVRGGKPSRYDRIKP